MTYVKKLADKTAAFRAARARYLKQWRAVRARAGYCRGCGARRPAAGCKYCDVCLQPQRAARAVAEASGLCTRCHEQPRDATGMRRHAGRWCAGCRADDRTKRGARTRNKHGGAVDGNA